MVGDADRGYRDINARLANARRQQQIATLQAEARRLHRARQWAAVMKVGEQLQAIDPAAADPDGVINAARGELAAEQQAAKLAADYRTGLRLIDAGRWEQVGRGPGTGHPRRRHVPGCASTIKSSPPGTAASRRAGR